MSTLKIYKSIDATSSSCSGPIGELAGAMNDALPGEGVEIFVGDEATKNDVEVWVKKTGNRLLVNEHLGDKFRIVVQKVR